MRTRSKKDASNVTRANLSEQVEAFIKQGGKVEQIPTGISGQTSSSGPRQIVLSHKHSS